MIALLVLDNGLFRFSLLKINFIKQNKASFIRDRCCHVTLSVHLIEPNLNDAIISDEFDASVATLQSAAASLNADCVMLRERVASADETEHQQQDQKVVKKTGQFLVRQRAEEKVSFFENFETVLRLFFDGRKDDRFFQS